LSAASTANFRTAVIRTLMETAPSRTVDRNIGQLQRHRNPAQASLCGYLLSIALRALRRIKLGLMRATAAYQHRGASR
jgi:hypothetical protein